MIGNILQMDTIVNMFTGKPQYQERNILSTSQNFHSKKVPGQAGVFLCGVCSLSLPSSHSPETDWGEDDWRLHSLVYTEINKIK